MKKETHQKITKSLTDSLGRKGLYSIVGAVLTLLGVMFLVTGINLPAQNKYEVSQKLMLMLSGFLTLVASILYSKVTSLINKLSERELPFRVKIVTAILTAYIYAIALGTLFYGV